MLALLVAANDSIQEVRDFAADYAQKVYAANGSGSHRRIGSDMAKSLGVGVMSGVGNEVGGEVGMMVVEASVGAGCSIM